MDSRISLPNAAAFRQALQSFSMRVLRYLRWRASNAHERLWKRAEKVVYHHNLSNTPSVSSPEGIWITTATADDIEELPGKHDCKTYREMLEGAHKLVVARTDSQIVAYLWLSFTDVRIKEVGATVDFDGDGYVWHVHVIPEYRERGIGSAMLRHCLNVGNGTSRCERVFCITEWSNLGMRKVLEKTGFEPPEHISFKKTLFLRTWKCHDREPGPFAYILDRSVDANLIN